MNTRIDDRRSAEQAAEWLHRMQGGGKPDERAAFASWLLESRRNVRQALITLALDRELRRMDPRRQFDVAAMFRAGGDDVIALDRRTSARWQPKRELPWWKAGLAASLAAAAMLSVWMLRAPVIETATGEQQSVQLDDGSVVHLNTQSRIRIEFSSRERDIRLLGGEALFSVEHDARRPFRVHAGETVVQALGTQFNVDHHGPGLVVSVVEGSVRVSNAGGAEEIVAAGEEVRVGDDGRIHALTPPDIRRSIAWRERRLEFQEDPLATVVAEFNRYNRGLKLRIESATLESRTYTGIFRADDPESLAQVLSKEKDVEITRMGREIVIRDARHRHPYRSPPRRGPAPGRRNAVV